MVRGVHAIAVPDHGGEGISDSMRTPLSRTPPSHADVLADQRGVPKEEVTSW